jgi:hypothetical protein
MTNNVISSINSVQGQGGWIQINQNKSMTAGDTIKTFLKTFMEEDPSSETINIVDQLGFQIDRVITFIEYNWVWILIATFLLFGLYICLGVKVYD